eukprot:2607264-Amphidinium_carterae.1
MTRSPNRKHATHWHPSCSSSSSRPHDHGLRPKRIARPPWHRSRSPSPSSQRLTTPAWKSCDHIGPSLEVKEEVSTAHAGNSLQDEAVAELIMDDPKGAPTDCQSLRQ